MPTMPTTTVLYLRVNAPGNWTDSRGVTYTQHGDVLETETGPLCGMCAAHHLDAASVLACHEVAWDQWQQAENDRLAELRNERALEDRGYWDTQAQDDYEAAMGVIQFDVALAASYR